jgi:hypothetical protein
MRVRQHVRVNDTVASKTVVFVSTFVIVNDADFRRSGTCVVNSVDIRDLCRVISDFRKAQDGGEEE